MSFAMGTTRMVGVVAGLVGVVTRLVGVVARLVGVVARLVGIVAWLVGIVAGLVGVVAGLVGVVARLVGVVTRLGLLGRLWFGWCWGRSWFIRLIIQGKAKVIHCSTIVSTLGPSWTSAKSCGTHINGKGEIFSQDPTTQLGGGTHEPPAPFMSGGVSATTTAIAKMHHIFLQCLRPPYT
ncbi:hypothetical protein E2C01_000326 [Portunus trituberculatus]|uniref:Uncharacterized protein n=1 Tax=Portunus trituberculatus TaxID=210409 RepID=A0A5B7CEX9_PORTR|nr:hypothetical protein [Portunus trituberculatus]